MKAEVLYSHGQRLTESFFYSTTSCMDPVELKDAATEALRNQDAAVLRELLRQHPALNERINEPLAECFGSPPIMLARTPEMLEVLLDAGADVNAKSRWWAGGFGLLHTAEPALANYAIQRGAIVDAHAAARLGKLSILAQLLRDDPSLVHARGGDGQTPLHFAATVEIAALLLENGADIDARDLDHESTPAQWMLDGRLEIARFLVSRGCETDLLMAAALGDLNLAKQHLSANPECIRMRVSDEFFPMPNPKAGGTIYQWTLGFHVSPHQAAKKLHHDEMFEFLMQQSPPEVKLINACWLGDEALARNILSNDPEVGRALSDSERRQLAHAARNNDLRAVQLMLAAGLSVTARGQHRAQPLHWACWHGNLRMVRELLNANSPLEDSQNEFQSTPLGWAIHGSENGWNRHEGSYPAVVEALLAAGAKTPDRKDGTEAVRAVLRRYKHGG